MSNVMDDSVVPTLSTKPTCEHGLFGLHQLSIQEGGRPTRPPPDFECDWCDGPVIATPEKCLDCGHQTPHADELVYCEIAGCNCDRTSVSTEAQTPEKCAHKTWRSDVGKWVRRCGDCGLIRAVTGEEMRDASTEARCLHRPDDSCDGDCMVQDLTEA